MVQLQSLCFDQKSSLFSACKDEEKIQSSAKRSLVIDLKSNEIIKISFDATKRVRL